MTKRFLIVALALAACALLVPSTALANFAIHGNYVQDTDACAGCHRAHTSISTLQWTANDATQSQHSALLSSSATVMYEFCYACHDATSQGADTNVQDGIYEGTLYGDQGAILNGGGFETLGGAPVTSTHAFKSESWGAYGGGYQGQGVTNADGQIPGANAGETSAIKMDCTSCHDPHGSANYRILKDQVYGNKVGGYDTTVSTVDPDPDGFVSSTETGWPVLGFRLHTAYPDYQPNYTTPMYAKGYDMKTTAVNADKGMSGWCAGCHATYNGRAGSQDNVYNAGDGLGLGMRHRHPINVPLTNYQGADSDRMVIDKLPLDHDIAEAGQTTSMTASNTKSDWVECLTCHRAHGTAATMNGWANQTAQQVNTTDPRYPDFVSRSGSGDPSALLRNNNRGVCEACHNK